MSDKIRRKYGVLSTPCSGTTYITDAMNACGVDVLHEKEGTEGFVCGFLVWSGDVFQRQWKWRDYTFDHVIRLVRHPLKCGETLPWFVKTEGPWSINSEPIRGGQVPWQKIASGLRRWVLTHERITDKWHPEEMLRMGPQLAEDWARCSEHYRWGRTDLPKPGELKPFIRRGGERMRAGVTAATQRERVAEPKHKPKRVDPITWAWWHEHDPEYADRGATLCEKLELAEE